VILTGFIKGGSLQQLFQNAALFVLPSFHEGLPISLLEAMSYGLPILSSDIAANTQVNLPQECYFKVGDEAVLISYLDSIKLRGHERFEYEMKQYDWDLIADQTLDVYKSLI